MIDEAVDDFLSIPKVVTISFVAIYNCIVPEGSSSKHKAFDRIFTHCMRD